LATRLTIVAGTGPGARPQPGGELAHEHPAAGAAVAGWRQPPKQGTPQRRSHVRLFCRAIPLARAQPHAASLLRKINLSGKRKDTAMTWLQGQPPPPGYHPDRARNPRHRGNCPVIPETAQRPIPRNIPQQLCRRHVSRRGMLRRKHSAHSRVLTESNWCRSEATSSAESGRCWPYERRFGASVTRVFRSIRCRKFTSSACDDGGAVRI
jgi:hypothetical protein